MPGVGGGLLSSSGGWKILKGLRKEGIRVKGDERILGDGDFVKQILESTEAALAMRYDLEARGYDFNRVVERVTEVMGMHVDQVTAYGKSSQTVKARPAMFLDASKARDDNGSHRQKVEDRPICGKSLLHERSSNCAREPVWTDVEM